MAMIDCPVDADLGNAVVHVTPGEKRHIAALGSGPLKSTFAV
jgi:hypothetical protein